MTEYAAETFEEIREMLQRTSWELLDEEQRDDLMERVVVPRWGKVTQDGVELKATAWAKLLGTTRETINSRAVRLRAREQEEHATADRPTAVHEGNIRGAKTAIKKYPALIRKLLADPEVGELIRDEVDRERRETLPDPDYQRPSPQPLVPDLEVAKLIRKSRFATRDAIKVAADAAFTEETQSLLVDDINRGRAGYDHLESAITSSVDFEKALEALLKGGE